MSETLYLAWRYLTFHKLKTGVLLTSITLILYLPVGLRVLVDQSSRQLTARAEATPLIIGSKGSPLELVLNSLYFGAETPEPLTQEQVQRVSDDGLALAIPLHTRFRARGHPIVGTTLDYFELRDLRLAEGRQLSMLGECVLGAAAARALGAGPGDHVISSPENVFDLAGVYPLKMKVVGVLSFSDGPDDDAIFVDVKTAWVIQGLGHGHQDLTGPAAAGSILSREGNRVTANASVVQYNEITAENIGSFHFHGDLSAYPVTAIIVVPEDAKASALLQGRYQSADDTAQIVGPVAVMDELLDTILTVERFVIAGAMILGLATLASAALVSWLSLRLRRREIETLHKIGGSRFSIGLLMTSEIAAVLLAGAVLATGMTLLTSQFGSLAIRALVRM
jgi:putative ABC transport system permease protein